LEFVTSTSAGSAIRERWLQNRGNQANGAGFEVKRINEQFCLFLLLLRRKGIKAKVVSLFNEKQEYKFGFVEFSTFVWGKSNIN
jgi:hypothetical protein